MPHAGPVGPQVGMGEIVTSRLRRS